MRGTWFLNLLFLAVGLASAYNPRFGISSMHADIGDGALAWAIAAVGMNTYIGVYRQSGGDVRTALATSFVIVYLSLLAILLIDKRVRSDIEGSDFGKSLVIQLTAVVTSVTAFYLGASAYVEKSRIETPGGIQTPPTSFGAPGVTSPDPVGTGAPQQVSRSPADGDAEAEAGAQPSQSPP
jgi:hypothetical protein